MMSPQQQLNRILPKTVKLNVQEEVDEEREISDAPRMLRRKVRGNYGKGFSFNKRRRTSQVALTRYVGERQVGKRIPGLLSKSSIQSLACSECEVRDKVQGKESLSLEPQVDMELVVAGVGVQQAGADQMGVLREGVEVEVEHKGQSNDHICSDRDILLAERKALRLKVQNCGLNDISNIATSLRMRQRKGRKKGRNISTMAPMIRYVGSCQRGKRLPGRQPEGILDVFVNLQQAAKATDQIQGGAIQEGDGDLGEVDDREGAKGGRAEDHLVDGILFKSYIHAEDMSAMAPALSFEEGEFGIECLIPVVSELGAFYSASELEDPLFLGATFTGS